MLPQLRCETQRETCAIPRDFNRKFFLIHIQPLGEEVPSAVRRVYGTANSLSYERYWAVDRLPIGEPTIGVPAGKGRAATRSCNP